MQGFVCRAAAVAFLTTAAAGCYQYRTSVSEVTPVEGPLRVARDTTFVPVESVTVWSLAWGLATTNAPLVDCQMQGLQEVTVRSNVGYALITLITLGFVAPKKIEGKCARPTPTEGSLSPPPSGSR